MPKKAKEMMPLDVKRLQHPRRGRNVAFAVGGVSGLLLQISRSGSKSWLLRAKVGIKRREIGLGGYPDVSLAQARERAREARDAIRRGVDPVQERKAARTALVAAQMRSLTFEEAAMKYLAMKLVEFKNEKHRKQWASTLKKYAIPDIGSMPVDDILPRHVADMLAPIWSTKTETAIRVRGRVEAVLSWAKVAGYCAGENPARWKGNLDSLLPKAGRRAKVVNHPAVALKDAPAWFAEVKRRKGVSARALEFAVLTVARSGEVRGATWDEIDFATRIWTVPAERMKMNREHRVPLSDDAIALLDALPRRGDNPYVFPGPHGRILSDMSLSELMRGMHQSEVNDDRMGYLDSTSGRPAVPHGLRSTFKGWADEHTMYPSEMAELALAHLVGSETERAYRRSDMIEKRRRMMIDWADFLQRREAPSVAMV
jgi:integrase